MECVEHKEKDRWETQAAFSIHLLEAGSQGSTLTSLEATLRLVDHIDAAFTAHDLAIAVTLLERAERVTDLHMVFSYIAARVRLEILVPPKERRNGGRYWDRTSGHYDVNVVLYR